MNKTEVSFNPDTIEDLFGVEAAERDDADRLKGFFYKSHLYEEIKSKSPMKIIIGFKGTGKSALMKMAYIEDVEANNLALWIKPDDLEVLYRDNVNDLNDAILIWKKELCKVIVSKIASEYSLTIDDEYESIIQWASEKGYKGRDFLNTLIRKLEPYITNSLEDNEYEKLLLQFLNKKMINIYIDDLDRGWKASGADKVVVSALLNALGDLTALIKGMRARVSLRTDVYVDLRSSEQSQDKFETNLVWVNWNTQEILIMLAKRISSFIGEEIDEKSL